MLDSLVDRKGTLTQRFPYTDSTSNPSIIGMAVRPFNKRSMLLTPNDKQSIHSRKAAQTMQQQ